MKVDSIIIHPEETNATYLRECILDTFPEVNFQGEACNYPEADRLIKTVNPALIFFDVSTLHTGNLPALRANNRTHFESIYISDRSEDAISAIRQDACGFLLKPLNVDDIIDTVGDALRRLSERIPLPAIREAHAPEITEPLYKKLVGIPTMDAMEFVNADEIIRCEGLQKCTRIVTNQKTSLVSSYCIGEFRRLLEEYGFFSCHKSHLINLAHVRKLTRDGFIVLTDNVAVPLARRKRPEFLQMLKHL